MTDFNKRIEELAEEYLENDCYAMDGHGPHKDSFIAGAKAAQELMQEKLDLACFALETYAMTNEIFPEYGNVAKTALNKIRGGSK